MPHLPAAIESLSNPRVKHAVRLRDRKHRRSSGETLIEGHREIASALRNAVAIREVYLCEALLGRDEEYALLDAIETTDLPRIACTEAVMQKISYRQHANGIVALAELSDAVDLNALAADPKGLYVVVTNVEKPGNLGTILRSADGAGVAAVFVCDRGTDLGNPNVIRASLGAAFSVPTYAVDGDALRAWFRQHGIQAVVASPEAAAAYTDADLSGPCALVVGAEATGVSGPWKDAASLAVKLPMLGQVDSLNVSAATAILLYEAVRQRSA